MRTRPIIQSMSRAAALMLACVLTAGCFSSSGAETLDDPAKEKEAEAADILEEAKTKGSPQQSAALADGHVTVEEMEASIKAWQTCLESTHWHLEEVYPDPIRGEPHFTYLVVPDRPDRDPDEADDCDIKTFRYLDVFAQTIQEQGPMDPAVRARTQSCLADAGVPTSPDDRTSKEVFATAGQKTVKGVVDCMLAAHRAEFPDREEISVGLPQGFDPREG